jgi:hypothetical protein
LFVAGCGGDGDEATGMPKSTKVVGKTEQETAVSLCPTWEVGEKRIFDVVKGGERVPSITTFLAES